MVPREVIDEIRDKVDIVTIVGEAVPLRKAGRNYLGLCPFHEEKTPSFTVSAQKQLYHCFGCGEGGTVFTFLMKHRHMSFPEALEYLAPRAGVDLNRFHADEGRGDERKEQRQRLLKVISFARDLYHRTLMTSADAEHARKYLKGRGLSDETLRSRAVGYAVAGWETLVAALGRDGIDVSEAARAGLVEKRRGDSGYYDLFRDRILFPIRDDKGSTVGFGGRVMSGTAPKYLNSPQTPVFDKRRLLYGLHESLAGMDERGRAVIVEGYMDQLALAEAGVGNSVATLGTALTDQHASRLKRYVNEVVVVFDGDEAGRKAARRSMIPLVAGGLKARVALLPEGEDPDSFVRRRGREAFENLLATAEPMLPFFVETFFRSEEDLSLKAAALEELADAIRAASDRFLREAIVDECVRLTGVSREVLRSGDVRTRFQPPVAKAAPRGTRANGGGGKGPLREEWLLLRLAAEYDGARVRLLEDGGMDLFSSGLTRDNVGRWIEACACEEQGDSRASRFVDAWEDEAARPDLARAFLDAVVDENSWRRVFEDCLAKLRSREIRRITETIGEVDSSDEAAVAALLKRVDELRRSNR